MLNPAHILEIAVLLLAAFLVGATAGSVARILLRRMRQVVPAAVKTTAIVPTVRATVEPALVTAPVIDPVTKPATPVAPDSVPAPDFTEAIRAGSGTERPDIALMAEVRMPSVAPLPALEARPLNAQMAPARAAGKTTSGIDVAAPLVNDGPGAQLVGAPGISAEVIPFPTDRAVGHPDALPTLEAAVDALLADAIVPDVLAEVVIEAPKLVAEDAESADIEPAIPPAPAEEIVKVALPIAADAISDGPAPELPVELDIPAAPVTSDEDRQVATITPPVVAVAPEPETPPPTPAEDDEAAAMRAIEGNWSPKRSTSRPPDDPAPAVDTSADHAVAAATAAVTSAVEAVMNAVAEQPVAPPGKPAGVDGPRHGVKDNLTNIIGILPIIETALNTAGIYHFDQIAHLTDENVSWLEGHLGIAGRIGREHWREQARDLAVISDRARKVAGKL